MTLAHKMVLYALLLMLGFSLLIPGLMNMFRPGMGGDVIFAETTDGKSHLRAVNGMIAALGSVSLWACIDIGRSRLIVLALGIVLTFLVVARAYSIIVDGMPGISSITYLAVEAVMAAIFLLWPPPVHK